AREISCHDARSLSGEDCSQAHIGRAVGREALEPDFVIALESGNVLPALTDLFGQGLGDALFASAVARLFTIDGVSGLLLPIDKTALFSAGLLSESVEQGLTLDFA